MNKKLLVLVSSAAMLLAACGGTSNKTSSNNGGSENSNSVENSVSEQGNSNANSSIVEVVESVSISKTEATLDIGGTLDLVAVAKPATLSDKSVTWSSSDEKVAKVSTGGRVTAAGAGTCKIKAASTLDPTKFAECTITVNKEQVLAYVDTPELNKAYKMGTFQANASVNAMIYAVGTALESQRFNSTQNWAEASDFFFEAGSAAGKYKVAIGTGAAKQYLNVVSADDYHFVLGATSTTDWEWDTEWSTIKTYTNKKYYFPGTYNAYTTISSCDIGMAAQDYIGRFYVKADKCDPTGVTLDKTTAEVFAGDTLQLNAKVAPLGATGTAVTWSVEGNTKVTVSDKGLVTVAADAVVGSTAKVVAKVSNTIKAECTITVKEKLNFGTKEAPLNIEQAKALLDKIGKGKTTPEKMVVKGIITENSALNTNKQTTAWFASDDGATAKAFEIFNGLFAEGITGYEAAGSLVGKEVVCEGWGQLYNTTYEFTNKDPNGTYDNAVILSVKEGPKVDATAIALDKTTAEVEQGKTLQLKATLTPATANTTIAWTVEGNEKVTVSDKGLVTVAADATGTATVKATAGTVSASCAITIKEVQGGQGGDQGGTDQSQALLTLANSSITKLVEGGSATSYATYNGTREVGGYSITTTDVLANAYATIPAIQVKKETGTLTVANIKATKVAITFLTTYADTTVEKFLSVKVGEETKTFTQDEINAAFAAKTATGTKNGNYDCSRAVIEMNLNMAAAGNVSFCGGSVAFYAESIVIY